MAMFQVTNGQLITATILSALIASGTTVSYFQWKERQALPEVIRSTDDKCVKVMNFKNGDAFNCEDVDVILRQYKTTVSNEDKTKEQQKE